MEELMKEGKSIVKWLTFTLCLTVIAFLTAVVIHMNRMEPAVYYNQKNSNNDRYTPIKIKLCDQDSLVMKHDTLYFYKNNSSCSIVDIDVSSGITVK